jgi:transglutaminase-like putative cysteine protease
VIYDISHRTLFAYRDPVSISHHLLHLTPRPCAHQLCRRSALVVDPAPAVCEAGVDYFGNPTTFMIVQQPHVELSVHAKSLIEVAAPIPPEPAATLPWDRYAELFASDVSKPMLEVQQFAYASPFVQAGDEVLAYARPSFPPGRPALEGARELAARIFKDFIYDGSATDVSTPVEAVLRQRRGVCQDFAHLEICCLRKLGLPARYVSGYLMTYPPPGRAKLIGADASHAWLSLWCPGHGWVDLDPTNDLIPGDEHITLAWGRDYGDVSPINGVIVGGGEHEVKVAVDVLPVSETALPAPAALTPPPARSRFARADRPDG